MLYPKIEDCLKQSGDCKYILAVVASKRAKELISHKGMAFSRKTLEKELSVALGEIADGKIVPQINLQQKK